MVVNCRFYWDGKYYTLSDFSPPANGTVYLSGTKSGTGEGTWQFSIGNGALPNTSPTQVAFKLYDFVNGEVTCDYRTTTLTYAPGVRDFFKVTDSGGTKRIELDATVSDPTLRIPSSSGQQNAVEIVGGSQPSVNLTGSNGHSIV